VFFNQLEVFLNDIGVLLNELEGVICTAKSVFCGVHLDEKKTFFAVRFRLNQKRHFFGR
jgi:hypothetical protein